MGGVFGRRHMNAALNAAGAMLESANEADSQAYDRSYKQWKDHLDLGLKAIEMMNKEANEIIERAGTDYGTAGKEAGAIRSFSVASDHLNTLAEAGVALANTDLLALNRLKNRIITEFGYAGPVDFNFVKSIVGSVRCV